MATPYVTLPSGAQIDSSKFSVELLDNTMRQDVEGGYTYTRARTTRRLRRVFKCTYSFLPNADKTALEGFWNTVKGNAISFDWTSPQNNVLYTVRFKGNLEFRFVGRGSAQFWDCSFELEEV
jgi:hypothetical protein